MALELGCYICTSAGNIAPVEEAIFEDGKDDLCLGFCLRCNGSVCTKHGAWIENPAPQYLCSVCVGQWILGGGDGGPLHRQEPVPSGGGGGAMRSAADVVDDLRSAGLKPAILDKVTDAFVFWAHRLYDTNDLARVRITEPVALRSVYSAYMEASGMAAFVQALRRVREIA
jgi:hypothetical protein